VSDANPKNKRSRDSMSNTLMVAIGVSLVCSVFVASAAIILKPKQEQNEAEFRQRIILDVAGLYEPGADIGELYSGIDETEITLGSGEEATIYVIRHGDTIDQVILPVEGSGLWGMMYGFLAVEGDGITARGLQFYEHAETPGLGDGVDKPAWQAQWRGKQLYDSNGDPQIRIVKGSAPARSDHQIDGLAGATLTGRGVNQFINYWLGDEGYGPYLAGLRDRE
jgi:Na+-transporting NADH:ubiquinone oxidoreductase subunit C